ncbi:hypothetical protein QQ045_013001 [Rhodiola kirilowii]
MASPYMILITGGWEAIGRCSISAFPVPKSFVASVMIPVFYDGMLGLKGAHNADLHCALGST